MVLTLGDVLFTTGRADLKPGATGNLNKLAAFLDKYPDRSVTIQGYTDSDPVADNDSAVGRQQNRRVEVIISNPTAALR